MASSLLLSRYVSRRGAGFVDWIHGWGRVLRFAGEAMVEALSPSLYNRLARTVTAKQIYFTAWQILPLFSVFIALFSIVLVRIVEATARGYGLSEFALELVVRVVVLELVPLLAALFVALRSGSAMTAEIALMRAADEFESLRRAGVDPMRFELVPRVAAAALSVVSLTVINCTLVLVLAYAGIYGLTLSGFAGYTRIVGQIFDLQVVLGYSLKLLLFGMSVAVIPIAEGLAVPRRMDAVPVAVLQGMVRLFFALALIEVLSLVATYI